MDELPMRLSCGHDVTPIQELIDGALSETGHRELDNHLILCGECRNYLYQLRETSGYLSHLGEVAPADLGRKVMVRVRREKARYLPAQFVVSAAATIVVILGMVFAVAPADFSQEVVSSIGDSMPDTVLALSDPLSLGFDVDDSVIGGLTVALVASGYLLSRLVKSTGVT